MKKEAVSRMRISDTFLAIDRDYMTNAIWFIITNIKWDKRVIGKPKIKFQRLKMENNN